MFDEICSGIFDEAYETTYAHLSYVLEASGGDLSTVKQEFQSLCHYDGLGWTGRGDVKQARMDGTLAAYQVFIKRHDSISPGA